MPNSMPADQMQDLARRGAKMRLEELRRETALIESLLRVNSGAPARRSRTGARPPIQRRRRGKLSAAGRAAIVAAQKARWAKIKRAIETPRRRQARQE